MADDFDVREFAGQFSAFMKAVSRLLPPEEPSPLWQRLVDHLGVEPAGLPVVTEGFAPYEHPNVQAAVEAYLDEPDVAAELVGITGHGREHEGLVDIVVNAGRHRQYELGAVDYTSVPVGVGRERACVSFGLYLITAGSYRLALLLRVGSRRTGMNQLTLEILGADPDAARRLLRTIRELAVRHHVLPPAIVVLEDVDLVAEERTISAAGMGNPLLFQLLNEMAGDADITFLLTTNRLDLVEPALAQRPGRVDLVVEVPLPDDAGRRRLLSLYGVSANLTGGEVDLVVAATSGATGSFFAELARRAELLAATAGDDRAGIEHTLAALAELDQSRTAVAKAVAQASHHAMD